MLLRALASECWRARAWTLDLFGEGPVCGDIEALAARSGSRTGSSCAATSRTSRRRSPRRTSWSSAPRVDAMPIAVQEAMAMARPSLVTRVGDMPRSIRDGETGFVAERAEPGSGGSRPGARVEARPRLREMAGAGRAQLLARFPRDRVGEFAANLLAAARGPVRP